MFLTNLKKIVQTPLKEKTESEKAFVDYYVFEDLFEDDLQETDLNPNKFKENIPQTYLYRTYVRKKNIVYLIDKKLRKKGFIKIEKNIVLTNYVLVERNLFQLYAIDAKKKIYKEIDPITKTQIYKKEIRDNHIYYQELNGQNVMIWSLVNDF